MVLVLALVIATLVVVVVLMTLDRRRQLARFAALTVATGDAPLASTPALADTADRIERALGRMRGEVDAARYAEARLGRALGLIPDGVVVSDERGNVVLRNVHAPRISDARHGEAIIEAVVSELLVAALRGEPADRELSLHGPPARSLVVWAAPLLEGDRLLGAAAVIEDVTEARRVEAVRRDFVANISHELKTPIGALALLGETLSDETDLTVAGRLADRMRDEAFRLNNVVDDLLILSQIEGVESFEALPVPVGAVVGEAVNRVAPVAEQYGVSVHTPPIDEDVVVWGDRRQLVSAMTNLLDNAVKYSEPGQSVVVRAASDGHEVSMVVEDHGVGIPVRDLDRIFERFYRVDQARSRETGGTGLGLSIVRHVARNHGGEVTVSSREGEGSTFMLVLPVDRGAQA
jgi:two-component system sensor histidine kinase SenX3